MHPTLKLPELDSCRILPIVNLSQLNLPLSPPRTPRAKWLFFSGFLALLTAFDTVHNYVAHRGDGTPISVYLAIQWGFGYWFPYFLLVPAAVWLVERYPLDFERKRSILFHGSAAFVFTYAHSLIAALPGMARKLDLGFGGRFFLLLGEDFSIDYVLYCSIVVVAFVIREYSAFKEREVRASQLEAGLAQAHLRAIQAQLNPHFFFNTLQGISVLALAGERDRVVEMLSRLSSLIRVSFDEHRPQQIPLAAEMEFLESYFAIQQLTFGDRLSVRCEISADTMDAEVPAMLLQPLVENAIVHGIAVKPGAGWVRVESRRDGNTLRLQISDSGPGFPAGVPGRHGIGLSATESRLRLLYLDAFKIEHGHSPEGGFTLTVTIPFSRCQSSSRAHATHRASAK